MRVCKKMWLLTALSCSLWNVRNAMDRVVTPPTPQFQGCGCMCHSFSGEFQILCYMATLKLRGRGGSILFLEVRWWSVCWGGSFRWLGISQQHRATGGRLLQTHSLPLLSNCTDEWEPFPIAQLAVAVTDIALNLGRKKGWFLRSISWDQFWVHFFFRNGCLSWWGLLMHTYINIDIYSNIYTYIYIVYIYICIYWGGLPLEVQKALGVALLSFSFVFWWVACFWVPPLRPPRLLTHATRRALCTLARDLGTDPD